MLVVEESSEMSLFEHLSNHVFRSPLVEKYISYEDHTFFENVHLGFENAKNYLENVFLFLR